MTEQSARDRIEILLTEYADQVRCEVGDESETATDIIAIVREAMLSEAEAGLRSLWGGDRMADSQRGAYTASLEELVDAAFGEDQE